MKKLFLILFVITSLSLNAQYVTNHAKNINCILSAAADRQKKSHHLVEFHTLPSGAFCFLRLWTGL